ncbi:hypothetical protein OG898_00675 [Streptomyces sp. NBC_00193]|uniref:hypothetical protein n=1 Tax=unclassified Streptomyces TaxID=2593676 RepID=UPI00224CC39B|nr:MULTISPECIES: hypothetical protein [unclassified Streptomyces]MCX5127575.1 hypothetical protein [Streptomyces sp. NBC_00347]MCX5295006.1 hypothetical protein [Streptomyces sp. NBC_00193]
MASSDQEWKLDAGTARLLLAGDEGIVKPLLLFSKAGPGATDLDALQARLHATTDSFGDAVRARGHDLILIGFDDGAAPLSDLADTVVDALRRTTAEQTGNAPLAVGGIGRGALAVRYALAATEYRQEDHRAGTYFSFNGTAPSPEEHTELAVLGGWPRLPQKLKLVAGDVAGDLGDEDFDDTTTAPADPGGLLIPAAQTSWLLDHLA